MRPVRLTMSPSFTPAGVAQDGDAHVVGFEVEHQADHAARELDELAGQRAFETVDARDAVTAGQNRARLTDERGAVEVLDLLLDDG